MFLHQHGQHYHNVTIHTYEVKYQGIITNKSVQKVHNIF